MGDSPARCPVNVHSPTPKAHGSTHSKAGYASTHQVRSMACKHMLTKCHRSTTHLASTSRDKPAAQGDGLPWQVVEREIRPGTHMQGAQIPCRIVLIAG